MCIPLGAAAWMIMLTLIPNYCNISVRSGSGNLFSSFESIKKVFYVTAFVLSASRPVIFLLGIYILN
jgi:hypothetical protein